MSKYTPHIHVMLTISRTVVKLNKTTGPGASAMLSTNIQASWVVGPEYPKALLQVCFSKYAGGKKNVMIT